MCAYNLMAAVRSAIRQALGAYTTIRCIGFTEWRAPVANTNIQSQTDGTWAEYIPGRLTRSKERRRTVQRQSRRYNIARHNPLRDLRGQYGFTQSAELGLRPEMGLTVCHSLYSTSSFKDAPKGTLGNAVKFPSATTQACATASPSRFHASWH